MRQGTWVLIGVWALFWAAGAGALAQTAGASCVGLSPPVAGPIIKDFAPGPGYTGHWGVDLEAEGGLQVRAAADGVVRFAGRVAHNQTLTLEHGGGLKTSYSYLERVLVAPGQKVQRGQVVARAGDESHEGLHFSTRIDGTYVDPDPLLGCLLRSPVAGLRLVPLPESTR